MSVKVPIFDLFLLEKGVVETSTKQEQKALTLLEESKAVISRVGLFDAADPVIKSSIIIPIPETPLGELF